MQLCSLGSSPLARGKPANALAVADGVRLIPARAGKTENSCGARHWRAAHPRSHGENLAGVERAQGDHGSSPLVRGKQDLEVTGWGSPRLIPARAGKTDRGCAQPPHRTAHPRSRGENHPIALGARSAKGSSPLARGKLVRGEDNQVFEGLIPARAGKTS